MEMLARMKDKIAFPMLILALSISIFAAGCSATAEVQISAEDAGSTIEIQTAQVLVITLASNPTTGYSWHVAELDESVLQLQGDPEFESESDLAGAGGAEVLRFKALAGGETTLTLTYDRPWETDVEPLEIFNVQIVVDQLPKE